MRIYLRRALRTALLTGGLMVVGTAAAHAATDGLVGDVADDITVVAPVTAPVTVDGVAVSVLGDATTESGEAAPASEAPQVTVTDTSTDDPSGDGGALVGDIADGTTVVAPITAPVTVGCTSVAVVGDADADCAGAQTASSPDVAVTDVSTQNGSADGGLVGDVLTDTDVIAPITAPVTVDGVAVSVGGDASTQPDGAAPAAAPDVTVTDGTTIDPAEPAEPVSPGLPVNPLAPADPDGSEDFGVLSSGLTGGRFGIGAGLGTGVSSQTGGSGVAASLGTTSAASAPAGSDRDALAETGISATAPAGLAVLLLGGGAAAISRRTLAA